MWSPKCWGVWSDLQSSSKTAWIFQNYLDFLGLMCRWHPKGGNWMLIPGKMHSWCYRLSIFQAASRWGLRNLWTGMFDLVNLVDLVAKQIWSSLWWASRFWFWDLFCCRQRRRTSLDELNMRDLYSEHDLISVSLPGLSHGFSASPVGLRCFTATVISPLDGCFTFRIYE